MIVGEKEAAILSSFSRCAATVSVDDVATWIGAVAILPPALAGFVAGAPVPAPFPSPTPPSALEEPTTFAVSAARLARRLIQTRLTFPRPKTLFLLLRKHLHPLFNLHLFFAFHPSHSSLYTLKIQIPRPSPVSPHPHPFLLMDSQERCKWRFIYFFSYSAIPL